MNYERKRLLAELEAGESMTPVQKAEAIAVGLIVLCGVAMAVCLGVTLLMEVM